MYFRIKKGQEHKLMISTDIHETAAFMYPAYQQALLALKDNVAHAKAFDKQDFCGELYGYSQNIIVFSGRRGQGKTSTMMSFSKAMKTNTLERDDSKQKFFSDCSFDILPPIDPTLMEGNQSILGVILSRMYHMAENRWKDTSGGSRYLPCGPTEAQKNELLKLFQTCLNGIAAINASGNDLVKSLRQINELSDSSILKQNIYILTQRLLDFTATDSKEHRFLVIQLDDTDFQIQKGYLYLEEIRKYFTIPNVIILMATDMKLLRNVICQYFFDEFDTMVFKHKIMKPREIEQVVRKYLDKLIAPSHVIHLPKLDDKIVSSGNQSVLCYEGDNNNNLLIKDTAVEKEKNISAQALILRYIYRKTGIVFAAPSSFYHHILPTTIRGLGQLLDLLSSMDDVPSVNFAKDASISESEYISQLKNHVEERVKVLETNLPKFENYFLNEWLDAKLQGERAEIIRDLSHAAVKESIPYIAKRLKEFYEPEEKPIKEANNVSTNADLYALIEMYEKKYRAPEDFCFLFSIRTHFTIMYHKIALRQMRADLDKQNPGQLLVFDFSPETTQLPDTYVVPKLSSETTSYPTFFLIKKEKRENRKEDFAMEHLCRNYHLLVTDAKSGSYFNFMHFITLALSFGGSKGISILPSGIPQRWIYDVQMSALTVAINWDVQRKICKKWEILTAQDFKCKPESYRDFVVESYRIIDSVIAAINAGHNEYPKMLDTKLQGILECLSSPDKAMYVAAIAKCFGEIEKSSRYNDKIKDRLCNIYKEAQNVKSELLKADKDKTTIESAMAHFDVFLTMLLENAHDILGEEVVLQDNDFSYDKKHPIPASDEIIYYISSGRFWNEFKKQFTKMCDFADTKVEDISKQCGKKK